MSRTRGSLSPNRKSKRLFENGYYQLENRDSSKTSKCIACNESPSNGRKSLNHPPQNSTTPTQSSPYATRFRSARKLLRAEVASVSSMPAPCTRPTHYEDLPGAASLPMISQQQATFATPSAPCPSSETLAAGERVSLHKKTHQTFPPNVGVGERSPDNVQLGNVVDHPAGPSTVENRASWSFSEDEAQQEEFSDGSNEAASLYEEQHNDNSFALLIQLFQYMAGNFIKIVINLFKLLTKLIVSDIVALIRDARAFAVVKFFLKLCGCFLFATLVAVYVVGSLPLLLRSAGQVRSFLTASQRPRRASSLLSGEKPNLLGENLQKLELSLEEMQLRVADRHASLVKSLDEMKRNYEENNLKISEIHKTVMSEVESMIGRGIALELLKNNEVFQNKVEDLQVEMNVLQANHTTMVRHLEKEISDKVGMTRSVYQPLVDQLENFKQQIHAIESKMNAFAKEQRDFHASVEQRAGNTSFLRELANHQFIENFILLLQKGANLNVEQEQISERQHHKYLAYILLQWLIRRGFVTDKVLKKMQDQSARNFTKLQNNFKEALEKNLAVMRKVPYKPGVTLESLAPGSRLSEGAVKLWIKEAINTYSSDRIGMPDYALESAGATVVTSRCSTSFQHKTALLSLLGIPFYYNANGPRYIIQPGVMPGECWAFKGSKGHAVIRLSATIRPEIITIDHIPKSLAYDSINSAPKDFAVYGLEDAYDMEGKMLGRFRFEESGESIQQFVLDDVGDSFQHIEVKVNSNWGQPDYTCLYRIRVHGTRVES